MPIVSSTGWLFISIVAMVFCWLVTMLYTSFGKGSLLPIIGIVAWLFCAAILASNGVFANNKQLPPPLAIGLALPLLVGFMLNYLWATRKLILSMPMLPFIWIHSIRLAVELGLWLLCQQGLVPQLMTFEGGNLDILSGITAPIVGILWLQKAIGNRGLYIWNMLALLLLANIVVRAVLSLPSPLQQLSFNQPNVAVGHFPFIWLPTFIVPVVFFCHIVIFFKLNAVRRQ